jgi:cell wall-associated protease
MKKISLIFCSLLSLIFLKAQKLNWQNLDLKRDSVFGISTEKAYAEILVHKKKFKPVIVGVIDSGVDTAHEDLRSVIWTNPKEKYNGKDNDKDGYIGDLHGWDFIGGLHGDVDKENLEMVRMIRSGKANSDVLAFYNAEVKRNQDYLQYYSNYEKIMDSVVSRINKGKPTLTDFENFSPRNQQEQEVLKTIIYQLNLQPDFDEFKKEAVDDAIKHFQDQLDFCLNLSFNPRTVVGDDTTNAEEHYYGNNDVEGPDALHGTHVSGIIGAVRNNGIGIDGIADHVWILSVRAVPDGDERDKDVANAIRYATDRGAKVINMSFGKKYSPDKKVVDEAVRYAMSKDVLIVHAAGNEGENLDYENNFPTKVYDYGSGTAEAWIEVGASGWTNDSTLVADFSNYGKYMVDVFAPGEKIRSSIPGNQYTEESGTSMAAPVVTGLAALIREYYPKFTAVQVKQIIMQSVVKPTQTVRVQYKGNHISLPFSEVCVSGGIVNVYQALLLADKFH